MPSNAPSVAAAPLLGHQTPRLQNVPAADASAGGEAIDLAASVGLNLDPWQQLVLDHSLREQPNGKWSAFEVGLVVSRQNGKGSILEARELAGLILFGEQLIIHSAHEFNTAMEAMRRLEFLIENSDEAHKVKRISRSHGEEGIELKNGSRIRFKTRTKAGGRGLSGDLVILDEAMILSHQSIRALMPTLSARPNPQIWYTGSAVDQKIEANGYVFAGVRKRGLDGTSPRLCFMEWSCEDGVDYADPQSWAQANPSLGYRISQDYIADEFDAFRSDPESFAVERLSIGDWPALGADIEPIISTEAWQNMRNESPQLIGQRTLALDRTPDRRTWVIGGAQHTEDGRVHIEIGYSRDSTMTEAAEHLLALITAWNPIALVIDARSSAAEILPYLRAAGIEPELTTTTELGQASGGFLDAALAGQLSHSDQDELGNAIAGAAQRDLPGGGFTWDRGANGGSIAHLVAATLAHWGLLTFSTPPKRKTVGARSGLTAASAHSTDDYDAMSVAF